MIDPMAEDDDGPYRFHPSPLPGLSISRRPVLSNDAARRPPRGRIEIGWYHDVSALLCSSLLDLSSLLLGCCAQWPPSCYEVDGLHSHSSQYEVDGLHSHSSQYHLVAGLHVDQPIRRAQS
ncbi:hypothetical protein SEVIR_7G089050v4 [Setaria viridis]